MGVEYIIVLTFYMFCILSVALLAQALAGKCLFLNLIINVCLKRSLLPISFVNVKTLADFIVFLILRH